VVIGEETFGKGSVNRFHELSDGSALYVTFARWLTPKGRLIEGKGLLPDIEVPLTEEDRQAGSDPQLDRALEYLKTGRLE
jgi:carboxyl-terminal processing protease